MTYEPHSTSKDSDEAVEPFTVWHIADIEPPSHEDKWLVEDLWLAAGVGILGGEPKLGKTFLAGEMALAVATGGQVLGRKAKLTGTVLFYGAEDTLAQLRERFDGFAAIRGVNLREFPVYLLEIAALRLEREQDVRRLRAAIEIYRPRLLVLDPFVRIARVDENSAAEVSAVLGSLREIQRDYDVAILVIHHARKTPAAHPNQALRGSSDFAAWSDSNLFLSRRKSHLSLSIEHRSAAAPEPIACKLVEQPELHLVLTEPSNANNTSTPTQIVEDIRRLLHDTPRALTTAEIRQKLRRRKADIVDALHQLQATAIAQRVGNGWTLTDAD